MRHLTLSLLFAMAALGAWSSQAQAQGGSLPSASAYDPATGVTTTSQGNADGSRTITKTDKDGKVISKETVPAPKKKANGPITASSTDPETGVTTTGVTNDDGSRTITKTDKDGKMISEETLPAEKPAKDPKQSPSGSSYDPDTGVTTSLVTNADGSKTITQIDKDGNVISKEDVPAPKAPVPAPPKAKDPVSGSSFDPDNGVTTTLQTNPDGSKVITRTDAEGNVISQELIPAPAPRVSGISLEPEPGLVFTFGFGESRFRRDGREDRHDRDWSRNDNPCGGDNRHRGR